MSHYVVIVTGGRDYPDREAVHAALDLVHALTPIWRLLHGACGATWPHVRGPELTGADRWAHEWAEARGVEAWGYPANWSRHGKRAGPVRNRHMIAHAGQLVRWQEDRMLVLACPGGVGTADCVRQARRNGLTVKTLDQILGPGLETLHTALASLDAQIVVRERQCARDVEVTWTPGPGAEPGPRGVVPGREETYPAEGEPVDAMAEAAAASSTCPCGGSGLRVDWATGLGAVPLCGSDEPCPECRGVEL